MTDVRKTDAGVSLLGCPFCGKQPHSHADDIQHNADDLPWNGQWIIECNACSVDSSTWGATKDKATAQWNTRSAPVPQCDAEPVAWLVLSDETGNIRIWWRDKERADAWCARHNVKSIPLYAAPARCDAPTIDNVPSCGQENDYRRAAPQHSDAGSVRAALEDVCHLLKKIDDLMDDEEAAEPLDDAIAYARRAMAIIDRFSHLPVTDEAGRETTKIPAVGVTASPAKEQP